jgi:hypothetical protein
MWIFPTDCELTRLWLDEARNDYFVLQKSRTEKSKLYHHLLGTVQNMFLTKQAPYRIVLLPLTSRFPALIVAVGETLEEITHQEWEWIATHIVPIFKELEQPEDIYRFAKTKFQSMVTQSSGAVDEMVDDQKFRDASRAFRDLFKVSEEERLVNYYSCAVWKSLPQQGWLYVSPNHVCFYSFFLGVETKMMIEIKDMIGLEKTKSMRIIPNGIRIRIKGDKEVRKIINVSNLR